MVKFQPMNTQLVYGFLDESPSLSDKNYFFCVGVLSTHEKKNKQLAGILKDARRRVIKKRLKSLAELKFHTSNERIKTFVLSRIVKQDVKLAAFVVDKEGRRVTDNPINYGLVIGAAIAEFSLICPALSLVVDKRYTSTKEEQEFARVCQETINLLAPSGVSIFFNPPRDSMAESLLQLADFIAGAMNSKYNQKTGRYVDLIQDRLVIEKVVKWTDLKRRIAEPRAPILTAS